MPARTIQNASWTVNGDASYRHTAVSPASTVFVPNTDSPVPLSPLQIDKPAFSQNVFNMPSSAIHNPPPVPTEPSASTQPSVPTQPNSVTIANRPRRAVRPVIGNRLIDLMGHHV